jgi:cytochrome b561
MQIFNSPTRYGAVAQSLHWLVVVLVILAWVLGVSDDLLPKGPAREAGLYIHITAGLLVIVLTFVRLLWRTADPSPPAESTEFGDWSFAGWMGLGARLAHVGLYVLLVAAPLVGIAVQFARGGLAGVRAVRDRFAVAPTRFRAQSEEFTNCCRGLLHCRPAPRRRWCIVGVQIARCPDAAGIGR